MFISAFEFSIVSSFLASIIISKLEYYGKKKSNLGTLSLELDYHFIQGG